MAQATSTGIDRVLGSRPAVLVLKGLLLENGEAGVGRLAKILDLQPRDVARGVGVLEEEGLVFVAGTGSRKRIVLNNNHPAIPHVRALLGIEKREEQEPKGVISGLVKERDRATILLHHNADPDAVGSGVALARALEQRGVKTRVIVPDTVSLQARKALNKYPYEIEKWDGKRVRGLVFILDTPSSEQLGGIEISKRATIVLIDHHSRSDLAEIARHAIIDEEATSTASMVYEILEREGFEITREIAFFLVLGIIGDTGYFRLITQRDARILSHLLGMVDAQEVMKSMAKEQSFSDRVALAKACARMEAYRIGERIVVFSQVGSSESEVALFFVRSFAHVAIVFNAKKGGVRVSARALRGLKGKIDLASLLSKIEDVIDGHAGGHDLAAGANGNNPESVEEAKRILLRELEDLFGEKARRLE